MSVAWVLLEGSKALCGVYTGKTERFVALAWSEVTVHTYKTSTKSPTKMPGDRGSRILGSLSYSGDSGLGTFGKKRGGGGQEPERDWKILHDHNQSRYD